MARIANIVGTAINKIVSTWNTVFKFSICWSAQAGKAGRCEQGHHKGHLDRPDGTEKRSFCRVGETFCCTTLTAIRRISDLSGVIFHLIVASPLDN
jgi:hypothetical protein